jgi:uncharacterized DUF497 family protein
MNVELTFEWHEEKAKANLRKHGVSFEEAKTAFNDPLAITFPDPGHSESENRYLSVGCSARGRILLVVHTEREANIRIISCRKAMPGERRIYEQREL